MVNSTNDKVTNLTIMSTNLNRKICDKYIMYHVIDDIKDLTLNNLFQYSKIIFYNVFNNCNNEMIKNIYQALDEKNICYINVTNNSEEALLTSTLIIYDRENIIVEGKTLEVFKEEKILKRIGIKLPFLVELSLLLQDYGLINKIYVNKESLVDALWK